MRRPWFAAIVCVIGLGLIIQANNAHAKLEDILYEKGQITKEEWLKTKADAEKEEAIIQQRAATEKWYEKLSIRGYTQLRYNYVTDDKKLVSQYDSSIGNNKGFHIPPCPPHHLRRCQRLGVPLFSDGLCGPPPEPAIITLPNSETSMPISSCHS